MRRSAARRGLGPRRPTISNLHGAAPKWPCPPARAASRLLARRASVLVRSDRDAVAAVVRPPSREIALPPLAGARARLVQALGSSPRIRVACRDSAVCQMSKQRPCPVAGADQFGVAGERGRCGRRRGEHRHILARCAGCVGVPGKPCRSLRCAGKAPRAWLEAACRTARAAPLPQRFRRDRRLSDCFAARNPLQRMSRMGRSRAFGATARMIAIGVK